MGFEGNTVTPQIRKLIQENHIGSILLTAKNLKCTIPTEILGCVDLTKCSRRADNSAVFRATEDRI